MPHVTNERPLALAPDVDERLRERDLGILDGRIWHVGFLASELPGEVPFLLGLAR